MIDSEYVEFALKLKDHIMRVCHIFKEWKSKIGPYRGFQCAMGFFLLK